MSELYITEVSIECVKHLKNITIPLDKNRRKHLIITGENGSGKTSLLDAMAHYLEKAASSNQITVNSQLFELAKRRLERAKQQNESTENIIKLEKECEEYRKQVIVYSMGIEIQFTQDLERMKEAFEKGQFIVAYYKADRIFRADIPKHVEKVDLKDAYSVLETPRKDFIKYLLDLKMTEALALTNGKTEKAESIRLWFANFDQMLKRIFKDESVRLIFDEDTFLFHIEQTGKELFDFNTLSSGYAAILDIVVDLIVRMQKRSERVFEFNTEGIVLIDEIENHLHIELQKRVLDLLITIFPNIQFVVSTHSPFILNSLENAVIFDLQNKLLVENGLSNVPYEGIVEGYFGSNTMSAELESRFDRYKQLAQKKDLSDRDFEEIARLEMYLDEIPDYLALGLTTEYQRLKFGFENRGDI